jgi:hypothetical protein
MSDARQICDPYYVQGIEVLTAAGGGEYCLARLELLGPDIMADVVRFFC